MLCWHIIIKPAEVFKYYGNRYTEKSKQWPRGSGNTDISAFIVSVGGCGVISKITSLQVALLRWWAQCVDLNYSHCQGRKSALGQHNSTNNSHWLYPKFISAEAKTLSSQQECGWYAIWEKESMCKSLCKACQVRCLHKSVQKPALFPVWFPASVKC